MPTFKQGDVVKVPFPYTDRPTRQSRPALVVSTGAIEDLHGLLRVVMITSAENRGWPGDIAVNNLALAGLPVPSVVRTAKIAIIEATDATRPGRLPQAGGRATRARVISICRMNLPPRTLAGWLKLTL
jgi:mRNA interferase MazF